MQKLLLFPKDHFSSQILKQIHSEYQKFWKSHPWTQMGMELNGAGLGRKVLREDWEGTTGKWWKVVLCFFCFFVFLGVFLLLIFRQHPVSPDLIVATEIWMKSITACPRDILWWFHICLVGSEVNDSMFSEERYKNKHLGYKLRGLWREGVTGTSFSAIQPKHIQLLQ